ncbi:MAG: response regulator [Pseudomonadota bacterium]
MRVLIVDDESLIASSLKIFLEDEGLTADTAASGEEAVEVLQKDKGYDICIMDMRLPGMDGNAAMRSIHAICPEVRFIVHTGSVNYIVPNDLKRLGIMDGRLFQKPLADMAPIAEAIKSLKIS